VHVIVSIHAVCACSSRVCSTVYTRTLYFTMLSQHASKFIHTSKGSYTVCACTCIYDMHLMKSIMCMQKYNTRLVKSIQTFLLPFEHLCIAKGNVMHKIVCITWFTLHASIQTEAKKYVIYETCFMHFL